MDETELNNEEKMKIALEAIELASEVMNYSRGDRYERECTEDSFNKFEELKNILIPKIIKKEHDSCCLWGDTRKYNCPICGKKYLAIGLVDHFDVVHYPILKNFKRFELVKQIRNNNFENLKVIC